MTSISETEDEMARNALEPLFAVDSVSCECSFINDNYSYAPVRGGTLTPIPEETNTVPVLDGSQPASSRPDSKYWIM